MGAGMSTELGERSLAVENRAELDDIQRRLIEQDETLTNVDLANRFIGDAALSAAVSAVSNNPHVTRLDLSFNGLTNASLPHLLAAVGTCPNLRILDLAGNRIGADGCALVAERLLANNSHPALEELYLFHCGLTDAAVVSIANALLSNTNLAVLNLDQNDLTNASWVMLHTAIARGTTADASRGEAGSNANKGLISLKVGLRPSVVPSDALVEEVAAALAENTVAFNAKRSAAEAAKAAAAAERAAEAEAAAEAERLAEEEAAQLDAAAAEAEEQRRAEEEELLAYEAEAAAQQQRAGRKTRAEVSAERERLVAKAMDAAYEWRQKLTQNGTMVKEWRDGFTTLTTQPGDEVGAKPTATMGAPRRLQACWCDPHDVSVPYAKTLHYHCKHEDLNRPLKEGKAPKYDGCYASGHVCASVGFYTEAKPDKSAAHFFASPPRAARDEGNDVYEDGNMTNVSLYTRSQTAASNATAPPAAAAIGDNPHNQY